MSFQNSLLSLGHVSHTFKLSVIKALIKTHSRALDKYPARPNTNLAGSVSGFTFVGHGIGRSKIYTRSRDLMRRMASNFHFKTLRWVFTVQNQNKASLAL